MDVTTTFLSDAALRPLVRLAIGLLASTTLAMLAFMLLHTLHVLGARTILYQKHQPIIGWSKRFYPACSLLIIFLLILMWLCNLL